MAPPQIRGTYELAGRVRVDRDPGRVVILRGAAALITGASSDIGAAIARRLAQEGAMVGLVARRWERLTALAEEVVAAGGTVLVVQADLTDPDRAAGAVEEVADSFGRLDILVNSAGVMFLGSALHAPLATWDQMVDLNVRALLHVTHAAVPYLIGSAATSPRRVADIVNISSAAGRVARPTSSVYELTKFGINGFSESLRKELFTEQVRVCVVEPGVDPLLPDDVADDVADAVADAVAYVVTRERRVAINQLLLRAGGETS